MITHRFHFCSGRLLSFPFLILRYYKCQRFKNYPWIPQCARMIWGLRTTWPPGPVWPSRKILAVFMTLARLPDWAYVEKRLDTWNFLGLFVPDQLHTVLLWLCILRHLVVKTEARALMGWKKVFASELKKGFHVIRLLFKAAGMGLGSTRLPSTPKAFLDFGHDDKGCFRDEKSSYTTEYAFNL